MTDPAQFDDTTLCDVVRRMGGGGEQSRCRILRVAAAQRLTFRRAIGAVVYKAAFLKDLLNPENTYDMPESEDVSATVHKGVAVVTLLVRAKAMREGTAFSGVVFATFVSLCTSLTNNRRRNCILGSMCVWRICSPDADAGGMWTRCNYFVGIESVLVGGKLNFGNGKLSAEVAVVGAIVSLIWYVMGADDRFLVRLYRDHVKDAAPLVATAIWNAGQRPYCHVGEVKKSSKTLHWEISAWWWEPFSTTRLATWIPLMALIAWSGIWLWLLVV
jgi:hypothetical protein